MNPAAASSAYDAVISAYYTVISIVIVYHLFAVQSWFDGVRTARRRVDDPDQLPNGLG